MELDGADIDLMKCLLCGWKRVLVVGKFSEIQPLAGNFFFFFFLVSFFNILVLIIILNEIVVFMSHSISCRSSTW